MLYHKNIFLPNVEIAPLSLLSYSKHAKESSRNDRYGTIPLPAYVRKDAELIEVEVENNKVVKAVYRQPLRSMPNHDICIVVIPNESFVKTVWINESTDKHTTLNKDKYASL